MVEIGRWVLRNNLSAGASGGTLDEVAVHVSYELSYY